MTENAAEHFERIAFFSLLHCMCIVSLTQSIGLSSTAPRQLRAFRCKADDFHRICYHGEAGGGKFVHVHI